MKRAFQRSILSIFLFRWICAAFLHFRRYFRRHVVSSFDHALWSRAVIRWIENSCNQSARYHQLLLPFFQLPSLRLAVRAREGSFQSYKALRTRASARAGWRATILNGAKKSWWRSNPTINNSYLKGILTFSKSKIQFSVYTIQCNKIITVVKIWCLLCKPIVRYLHFNNASLEALHPLEAMHFHINKYLVKSAFVFDLSYLNSESMLAEMCKINFVKNWTFLFNNQPVIGQLSLMRSNL